MKLFYYKNVKFPNFGDELNAWLWERLLGGMWDPADGIYFSAIGSIISRAMMPSHVKKWIIFGSGAGYGPRPDFSDARLVRWLAVRGPISAKLLGLPPETAVIDGAALLSLLDEYRPLSESERSGIVFMPHYEANNAGDWEGVCREAGLEYLDPTADSRAVLSRIRSAKLVLSDAMHAAIVADSLRVPWIPLATSQQINTLKWLDWTLTVDVPYEPIALPPSSLIEAMRSATLPWYAEKFMLQERTMRAAIDHYNWRDQLTRKTWWKTYEKWARRLLYTGPRTLLRSSPASSLRSNIDSSYRARAAEALTMAAKQTPFLSDETIFRGKVQILAERLAQVPSMRAELMQL